MQWSEVKWSEVKWSEVKWSEVKWREGKGREGKGREVKGSKLWWLGCERCLSVVKSNGGKIKVKCGCVSSWHSVFHYCYCLVYGVIVLNFLLINLLIYSCNSIWIVFIVCGVFFIICVDLCAVFCLSVVCYFVWCVLFVYCPIVVLLPPGRNPVPSSGNFSLPETVALHYIASQYIPHAIAYRCWI
jgi:hypothetical protein